MKECVAMLLAGGQGSRLYALTQSMAKPAVYFGGKYRIIDFPLSNCVNSGIDTVGVLTQYQPLELNEYLGNGQPWDLDRLYGGVHVLPPYQKATGSDWYKGTAKEASLKEGQFSISRGGSTVVYDKAVIMSADAYKVNSENAIILTVNSGGTPRLILDDESAVVRAGTGNNGGYIEATQTSLKIGATVYGQSSFSTYTVNWRQVNGVWVLAAQ